MIAPTQPDVPDTPALDHRPLNRKLARVQAGLNRIDEATADTEEPIDHTLLSQYYNELSDYKKDLATLYEELASEEIPDEDDLFTTHSALESSCQPPFTRLRLSLLFLLPMHILHALLKVLESSSRSLRCTRVRWQHHSLEAILGSVYCGCTQ